MILWTLLVCLWVHIDTTAQSGKDVQEVTVNQLHVLWPDSTAGLLSGDVTAPTPPSPFLDHSDSFVNVTVQLGATATLHCRVNELTDKTTVSWLKKKEGQLRLVAVGLDIYSGDSRYAVALVDQHDWSLSLHEVEESDAGLYQCQVSAHPPLVHTLYLHVVVPELQIWDERGIPIRNKFYNAGSTIELKCSISKVPKPTHFILWKHGTRILNYDLTRGGISVKTDMIADGVKSRLFIANVGPLDSGNYTCSLQDVAETTVTVHVLNGETPAAMQHGGSSCQLPATLRLVCLLTFSLLLHSR